MTEKIKTLSRFSKGLLIYAAVLLLIALVALTVLYGFLGAYEASRPQAFVKEYLAAASLELPDECEALLPSLDENIKSEADSRAILLSMHEGASYNKLISQSNAEATAYALSFEGKAFATLRISQTGKSSFGMARWELKDVEYDISSFANKLNISLPEDYSLYLNGSLLGKDYITDTDTEYEHLALCYEDFPGLPRLTSYESGSYLGEADMKVLDATGKELSPDMINEAQFLNNCSASEMERLELFADEFLLRYIVFSADLFSNSSRNFDQLLRMVLPESHMHRRMRLASTSFGYSDVETCRIVSTDINVAGRLSDGHYFIDVDYVSEVIAKAGPVETPARARIIITEQNGVLLAEGLYHY